MNFKAAIDIIGINPFVSVPQDILDKIFIQAGKDKGHIPVCGTVNGKAYRQTLLRYAGMWRLYINTTMLRNSPGRIGETIEVSIQYDSESRAIKAPAAFLEALNRNRSAKGVYEQIAPSLQKEINRYLANLKSPESLERNIARAINFLNGKERFIGRDKPL